MVLGSNPTTNDTLNLPGIVGRSTPRGLGPHGESQGLGHGRLLDYKKKRAKMDSYSNEIKKSLLPKRVTPT